MSEINHSSCRHRVYGLTCHQFDALQRRAAGRCERCGCSESDAGRGQLVIDHEHRIGPDAVRGLVCSSCNSIMGQVDRGSRAVDQATEQYLSLSMLTGLAPRHPRSSPTRHADGVRITISMPHLLARIMEDAAGGNVSAWMTKAAKELLLREEVAAVARYEQEQNARYPESPTG